MNSSKVVMGDEKLSKGDNVTEIVEAKKDKHGRWLILRGEVFVSCRFLSVSGS
jgi:hypothetical protein